jgi:hypothetical protein
MEQWWLLWARVQCEGREPEELFPPRLPIGEIELADAINHLRPSGKLDTRFEPESIYQPVNNASFDGLFWRCIMPAGTLGHGRHYTFENDTGPDDANHGVNGMFILNEPP